MVRAQWWERVGVYLVLDPTNRRLTLFGGKTENGDNGETWTYDLAANHWTQSNGAGQGHLAGRGSSGPFYLANLNGTLFFAADVGEHGVQLWNAFTAPHSTRTFAPLKTSLTPDEIIEIARAGGSSLF